MYRVLQNVTGKTKTQREEERERKKKSENVHGSVTMHCSMICDLDHSSWSIYAMHQVPTLG